MFDSFFCQSYCLLKSSSIAISKLGKLKFSQISLVSTLIYFKSSPNIINSSVFKLYLNINKIGVVLFTMLTKKSVYSKVFNI